MTKYGRKIVVCPFDKKPCDRGLSSLDGDLECYPSWAIDKDQNLMEIRSLCSRLPNSESVKFYDSLFSVSTL